MGLTVEEQLQTAAPASPDRCRPPPTRRSPLALVEGRAPPRNFNAAGAHGEGVQWQRSSVQKGRQEACSSGVVLTKLIVSVSRAKCDIILL